MPTTAIERHRGDTYSEVFLVKDDAGDAVSLSGATVKFTVKEHAHESQTDAVIAKTTSDDISITDASGGEFTVAFVANDSSVLAPKTYSYDAEVTLSSGAIHTVASGAFRLLADITTG